MSDREDYDPDDWYDNNDWYNEDDEYYDDEEDEWYEDEDDLNDGLDDSEFPNERASVLKTTCDDFMCFPTYDEKTGKPTYFGLPMEKTEVLEKFRWNERKVFAYERDELRMLDNWKDQGLSIQPQDHTDRNMDKPRNTTWDEVLNDED
jgi:hypothetical protein